MDENNKPQSDFDLDAALAEKFQQVQQDANRLRAMNDNTDTPASSPVPEPTEVPQEQPEPETGSPAPEPESPEEPAEELPQFDIGKTPEKPAATTEDDKAAAKERKARYKLKRQLLITNRIGAVVRIFAIGTIIFGGSIFLLVGTRPTESAEENRKLTTPPSFSLEALGSGDYVKDLMHYYEDTVPGRSSFKHMISKLESYQGLQGEDKVQFYGNIAPVKKEETADADSRTTTTAPVASGNRSTETTTATTVVTEPEPDPVEIGDGIVLVDKRAISIYGGSFSRGEKYATTLNEYKKQLGSKVNVYSLVAPTAVSFYLPDSYAGYTGSEPDNIDHIDENLKDVKAVDAYAHWRHTRTRTSMPAPTTTGCRWGHTTPQKPLPRRQTSASLPCPATPRPPCPAIWAACTRSPRVPSYRRIRRTSPIIRPTTSTPPSIMTPTSPTNGTASC